MRTMIFDLIKNCSSHFWLFTKKGLNWLIILPNFVKFNAIKVNPTVNTDLKLSEITGLKMYFFTGLNAALHVVPCNLSYDMICQKF